jgi:uncharacterized protein
MTANLPSVALLESTHKFPGIFTFKVIGDTRSDLTTDTLNSANAALGQNRDIKHSIRQSAAGSHTAITLNVPVHSALEIHAVYNELLKISGIRAIF